MPHEKLHSALQNVLDNAPLLTEKEKLKIVLDVLVCTDGFVPDSVAKKVLDGIEAECAKDSYRYRIASVIVDEMNKLK